MAIDADKALPYGLRDIKVRDLGVNGDTPGSAVDLPVAQTFTFTESTDSSTLRGDDVEVAEHDNGPSLEWEMSAGGIAMEALAVINGGTVTETGVTPNVVREYVKLTTDTKPYFKVEGQSMNDNGGDTHGTVFRAKTTGDIEYTAEDGEFMVPSFSGKGLGSLEAGLEDRLYKWTHNETVTDISTATNEVQLVTVTATGGTFTLTYSGQTTAAIAEAASEAAVQVALEALSNIAPGDVEVDGLPGGPWEVTFQGTLAATNVAQMTADATSLTPGGSTAVVTTLQQGSA